MIYYLGELIECGELNVTSANSVDGWLKLAGDTAMIRFELDSIEVQALIGCQMKFAHSGAIELPDVDEKPKYASPAIVDGSMGNCRPRPSCRSLARPCDQNGRGRRRL